VVDDEALTRMAAADAFHEAGFVVIEKSNAAAAIQALEGQALQCQAPQGEAVRIDALFTDVNMPGSMDGIMLAHYTHEHWPAVSLLVTSGQTQALAEDMPDKCRFFRKPYDIDRVVSHIRQMGHAA